MNDIFVIKVLLKDRNSADGYSWKYSKGLYKGLDVVVETIINQMLNDQKNGVTRIYGYSPAPIFHYARAEINKEVESVL